MARYTASDPVVRHFAALANISESRIAALAECLFDFYAGDEMLIELRLVRIIDAIKAGDLTIDEAIAEYGGNRSAA